MANTRCECRGTHHNVVEDISDSSMYPKRHYLISTHFCHCSDSNAELSGEELAAVHAYDPPPVDDDPDCPPDA